MSELKVSVTSPEGVAFQGTASSVVVPELTGELGILPRHAPLIGRLGAGDLRIRVVASAAATSGGRATAPGSLLRFFVEGGFVHVQEDRVSILAAAVEPFERITPEVAEERLRSLLEVPPDRLAPDAERERYLEQIGVARRRVRLARAAQSEPSR